MVHARRKRRSQATFGILALAGLVLVACPDSPDSDPKATAGLSAAEKQSRCHRIIESAAQEFTTKLARQLKSLDGDRHAATIACLEANPKDPSACMQENEAQVYQSVRAKQEASCRQLPDKMLFCLEKSDRTTKECALAHARHHDLVVSLPQAQGPEPSWNRELDSPVRSLLALKDGTWLVRQDDAVLALAPGRQLWKTPLAAGSPMELTELPNGMALTGTEEQKEEHKLAALDLLTGKLRWKTPALSGQIRAIFTKPDRPDGGTELLLDNGEWWRLQASRCRAGKPDCIQPTGLSTGGAPLGPVTGRFQTPQGRTIFSGKQLIHCQADGKPLFRLQARDRLEGAVPHEDGRILVSADGWIFIMDPANCHSDQPITIVPKTPKPTSMEELDLDSAPPPSCISWRMPISIPVGGMPVSMRDRGLIMRIGDRMLHYKKGKLSWKSSVGAVGDTVSSEDGRLFTLSLPLDKRDVPGIRCMSSSTGLTLWRTPLPKEWIDAITRGPSVGVKIAGPWLVAYAGKRLTALDLRTPPQAPSHEP